MAAQAPNEVIHLISSMNHPSLHWEMNEAWILSDSTSETPVGSGSAADVRETEKWPDGRVPATWSGKRDASGRYVLDGAETWYAENDARLYAVTWRDGVKTGTETWWRRDGKKIFEWEHGADGKAV